jgi:antitoxin (DNA-binding transcriptional repressor) of toxin-antitoxin stability system
VIANQPLVSVFRTWACQRSGHFGRSLCPPIRGKPGPAMIVPAETPEARSVDPVEKVASGSHSACMRAIGIKVLKNKLSEYMRLAASGETVLVTDRDRVVAELRPPSPERPVSIGDALLADAVGRGLVLPPREHHDTPPPRASALSLEALLAGLDADSSER